MADPRASVLYRDENLAIGSCSVAFITVLRKPARMEQMREIRRHAKSHISRCGKTASISVLEEGAFSLNVSTEEREEMAAMMRELRSEATVVVVEGSGFRAAATRTLIAGVYLLARPDFKYQIVSTVDEATRWLAPLCDSLCQAPISAAELRAATDTLRRAIGVTA